MLVRFTVVLPFVAHLSTAIVLSLLPGCATTAPPVMSYEAYRNIKHPTPYVLELPAPTGRLLYYGASHVYEVQHSQITEIQERWATFRPTYALNEGGEPPVFETVAETVGRHGESALVRWLAKRDGIPVATLEPAVAASVAALSARFSTEQIKLYHTLRQVVEQRRRSESFAVPDLDKEIARVLRYLSRIPGLEGPPRTLKELEASTDRLLPQLASWRDIPRGSFAPAVASPIWTNHLSRAETEFRDTFMIDLIARKVVEGHRVFAVVGASHVVVQESALRWRVRRTARLPEFP
jgi:hypothetical protein